MTPTSEFDYKKYLNLICKKRYLFVVIALGIMTGMVAASYLMPEKYEAKCTVFIERSVINDLVRGIAVTPSFDDKTRVLGYAMKSRTLLLKVLNDLDLNASLLTDGKQEKKIKEFQDKTNISMKDKEGLFIISYNDENPRLARDYVNTLVRRYIEENSASSREQSYDATKFLLDQIATVKAKLDEAEEKVNSYKAEKANFIIDDERTIMNEISNAQRGIDEIIIKRNQLEDIRNMVSKNDPLQSKLAGLQKRLQDMNVVYTDKYPEVIEVKNEIESVKTLMKNKHGGSDPLVVNSPEIEKIAMEQRPLRAAEMNLRRFINSKRALLRSVPAARSSLAELESKMYGQKNLYDQLMGRLGQSEFSKQMQVQDKTTTFRIVDPAIIPTKPFSPNRVTIMLLGILAGLAGSFALLILLDYLDQSVRDIDTLKSLGIPILAIVPKIGNIAELHASKKRDVRFFTAAVAYFSIILATLSIEFMRNFSINLINPVQIKQNLSNLKNMMLK